MLKIMPSSERMATLLANFAYTHLLLCRVVPARPRRTFSTRKSNGVAFYEQLIFTSPSRFVCAYRRHRRSSIYTIQHNPPPPLQASRLNIPPQPPQPLLRPLQHLIILAHRKPQPVFHNMRIRIREKFRRRNRRNAQLFDAEPAELEVARSVGYVWWERVIRGEFDFGEVDEDEVAAFWV